MSNKITKKLILLILAFLAVILLGRPVMAANSGQINASAALIADATTGQVIYDQNANQKLPIASISKLLTVLVIEDEIQQKKLTWDTQVKITPEVAAIANDPAYSTIGLQAGQSYSVRMLVDAALVKSADGAALALSMAAGDKVDEFNLKMIDKAKELGISDATIVNSVGLTNGDMKSFKLVDLPNNTENSMSARDVAIIARYLVQHYPELLQVTAQKEAKYQVKAGEVKTEKNLNKMLPGGQYTVKDVKIDGLKTGTSDAAGACFVSTGTYQGHRIITVVLHANGKNKDARFTATQQLYQYLKTNEHLQKIKVPTSATTKQVEDGAVRTVKLQPRQITIWAPYDTRTDYTIGVKYRSNRLTKKGKLEAPIWKDQTVGKLQLSSSQIQTLDNEPLAYDLTSTEDVQRGNWWQRLWH